jgi:3-dehydroquinate dehydratase / shikimate dehydrogenase
MISSAVNRICIAIRESTPVRIENAILETRLRAGYLELRLDYLEASHLNVSNLKRWVQLAGIPIIATLRRKANGGEFLGTESEQVETLKALLGAGVSFLDVEIETVENFLQGDLGPLRRNGTKIISSYHNFEQTPAGLETIYKRLVDVKPDVLKIATLARSFSDNFRLLALVKKATEQDLPIIAVAMGDLGVYSRIIAPSRGSLLGYASFERGRETAPGQIPAEDLDQIYTVNQINKETQIYGVLGYPLGHSLSPYIHNPAFRKEQLNCRYLPFSIKDLTEFRPYLKKFGGFSVTIPHKVNILDYVDNLDDTARATGAANTLVKRKNKICAFNTDVHGIRYALREAFRAGIQRAVLLGAGGAARAAATVLREAKCRVTVLARDLTRARSLAEEFAFDSGSLDQAAAYHGDLLINATSVGMSPQTEETPLDKDSINYRYVFDMVYNPLETRLMRESRDKAIVISGVEMFIAQAVKQFELWTGLNAPQELMHEIVLKRLAAPNIRPTLL